MIGNVAVYIWVLLRNKKKNNILARWRAFNKGLSSQNQFAGANKKLSIPTEKGEFTLN